MWEGIPKEKGSESSFSSSRLKVPNGWIVRSIFTRYNGTGGAVALVFVPDRHHEWKLKDTSK